MIFRLILFAIMALGLAGFGTIAWISAYPPPPHKAAHATPEKVALLVVARDVQAGILLKSEDLGTREFLSADVPTGATPDSADARRMLVGGMVRRALSNGDVILPSDVMRPGDHGFLAAVLKPGMNAITIGVDAVSGAAGLIWPGDSVDVIMTQLIDDSTVPLGKRISAQTVLHAVRVIAIDQELVQGASPGSTQQQTARTVTLEVTPVQAESLQVARRIGELSLTVCAAQASPPPTVARNGTVFAEDVSHALAMIPPKQLQPNTLHLFQGTDAVEDFRF